MIQINGEKMYVELKVPTIGPHMLHGEMVSFV